MYFLFFQNANNSNIQSNIQKLRPLLRCILMTKESNKFRKISYNWRDKKYEIYFAITLSIHSQCSLCHCGNNMFGLCSNVLSQSNASLFPLSTFPLPKLHEFLHLLLWHEQDVVTLLFLHVSYAMWYQPVFDSVTGLRNYIRWVAPAKLHPYYRVGWINLY